MGLGDILSGLAAAAGGYEQGTANRQALERKARQDLLAQQLQGANLDINRQRLDLERQNYQSEAERRKAQTENERARLQSGAGKLQHLVDPVTGQVYGYDPINNTIVPATEQDIAAARPQPTGGKPARINPPPKIVPYTTAEGGTGVARLTPGGQVQSQTLLGEKPLTPQERTAESRSQSAETSVDNIERIARSNPQALNEAIAALRLSHYGKVGQAAADVRNAFSSSEGQELYGELSNVLLAVAPTYGGARPTDILLNLETATSTPGVGGSKQALNTALRHMRDRLRDLRAQGRLPLDNPTPVAPQSSTRPAAKTKERVAPPGYHWDGVNLVRDQ